MSENNKTKKILFTILVIVVIVALGLIVYQYILPYSGYKAGTKVQEGAETEEAVEEGGEETLPVAQESEEIADIMSEAIRTQDIAVCEKITDENIKGICKINAIIAKAEVERDTTICDQLEEEIKIICKDNVIINKAFDSKDPTLCENLVDKTKVDYCKKEVVSLEQE